MNKDNTDDGKHIENVGMLKMDFLGLKTLSIIKDAIENVKMSSNIDIDIVRVTYRHNHSSFSRCLALAATPACSEKPAAWPVPFPKDSSIPGRACRVPTVGALGEDLAAPLRTYGEAIGDRISPQLIHRFFIQTIQRQVTMLYILFQ